MIYIIYIYIRTLKQDFQLSLYLAWVCHELKPSSLRPCGEEDKHADEHMNTSSSDLSGAAPAAPAQVNVNPMVAYQQWVEQSGLSKCYQWKSVLNGGEVSKLINLKGPALGKVMVELLEWQLKQPNGEYSREQAQQWLLDSREDEQSS